jgi:hypothetical protein
MTIAGPKNLLTKFGFIARDVLGERSIDKLKGRPL